MRFFAVLVIAGLLSGGAAASVSPADRLLILDHRAGPYEYLVSFGQKPNQPKAYEVALSALGTPTSFKVSGNLCRVTWAAAGVTVGFASELQPCATGHLYESVWYGMSLFGSGWHTRTGVRVGGSLASVRRAYPGAKFVPGKSGWVTLIVAHDQELTFTKLAVTVDRAGRVRTIEVPAAYIY